ncbi:choice-of-anchor Q domain-containing protein [Pseudomarimonas arenosa]|uniref:CSLREA domain-containing protein n=1 Tax=Pseudomarimonas arenosa TaxID=2774145 RepID=A0AAW3ZHD4_9GAMM|nr:choice-of-anchor Q domain-containing protein [Pseudomarimonas arenosa]MBD8524825.1 hypothetical protein [Pseudomarimonas arenosa]
MPRHQLLALAVAQALFLPAAEAATITLTNNTETIADDGFCTLPEAIENANGDSQNGRTMSGECAAGSGPDTISLAGYSITLTTALPTVVESLNISGGGGSVQRSSAVICDFDAFPDAGEFRLLTASSGNLELSDITLQNGCADNPGVNASSGGAVSVYAGNLSLTGVTLSQNSAVYRGGAIHFTATGYSLTINSSSISNNTSNWQGGAIHTHGVAVTIDQSSLNYNGTSQNGGALAHFGGNTVLITNSELRNNRAPQSGGGALFVSASVVSLDSCTVHANSSGSGSGGGLFVSSGSLQLMNSTVSSNFAQAGGGGVFLNTSSASLIGSTFSQNTSSASGGGVRSGNVGGPLLVQNSQFNGNFANNYGGGLYASAPVTLDSSTFSHNRADGGAGVRTRDYAAVVQDSTFSFNTAVYDGGGLQSTADLSVTRSTFQSNTAGIRGGGVYATAELQLQDSTLAYNSALQAGGLFARGYVSKEVRDSSLIGNLCAENCQLYSHQGTLSIQRSLLIGGGCYSQNTTNSYNNLSTVNDCAGLATQVTAAALNLGALRDNGGATQSVMPGIGSIAIDAGGTGCAGTDQRGVARAFNGQCDVGAVEIDETAQTGVNFLVNAADDLGDSFCGSEPGECTLRDALFAADSESSASTISFSEAVFTGTQTLSLSQGQLEVLSEVSVEGPGSSVLIIDAAAASRHFGIDVSAGDPLISLSGLTLQNGSQGTAGGAIHTLESLQLDDVVLQGNTATRAAAIGAYLPIGGSFGLSNSRISNSHSSGGIYGAARIGGSSATVSVLNSVLSGNTASYGGSAQGGALMISASGASQINLQDSQFYANLMNGSGQKSGAGLAIFASEGSSVSLSGLLISENTAGGTGQGYGRGGGLWIDLEEGASLTLRDSTIDSNLAARDGGSFGVGGGLGIEAHQGNVQILSSTISGNRADDLGGGLFVDVQGDATVTLADSTVSGNHADDGGGALTTSSGSLEQVSVLRSTVVDNTAGNIGGGLRHIGLLGTLSLQGNALANNQSLGGVPHPDLSLVGNPLLQISDNLIGDYRGSGLDEAPIGSPDGSNNLVGSPDGAGVIDPRLEPLADNGGDTLTHRLIADSPLIDRHGNCSGLTDQLGRDRGIDGNLVADDDCDVGAVEFYPTIHRDGFEDGIIVKRFEQRSAMLSRAELSPRLKIPGQAKLVLRAGARDSSGLLLVHARRLGGRIELQLHRFEHGEWHEGAWAPLRGEQALLRW